MACLRDSWRTNLPASQQLRNPSRVLRPESVLRVDYARWGQTPEDLRHLALSAPHARTRERALALFDITQHRCATQVAVRTGRRAHTVISWVHAYNAQGPDALTFRRTGGRRPFFAHTAQPNWARRSAPLSARPRHCP